MGEMSAAEKNSLSPAVQSACKGKQIRNVKLEVVTEEEWNKLQHGHVEGDKSTTRATRNIPGCKVTGVNIYPKD